jgi:hypothetical protein
LVQAVQASSPGAALQVPPLEEPEAVVPPAPEVEPPLPHPASSAAAATSTKTRRPCAALVMKPSSARA